MNRSARIMTLAILATGMVISLSGCNKLLARDHLNRGVEAYKLGHDEEAIDNFQKAMKLDPDLAMAKTYLATAYADNVVPGLSTPENVKKANAAIAIFSEAIDADPSDVGSMKRVASIYFNIKDFDQAKDWQKKILAIDPKDPEADYMIGACDWIVAHQNVVKELAAVGSSDDGEGNVKAPKKALESIRRENTALVDEAMSYLQQAVTNRENYDEAMQYINLVYRCKADDDFNSPADVKADIDAARSWSSKAMGARKINDEKKNAGPGGITMDSSGAMK